jgi:hypothetical protein
MCRRIISRNVEEAAGVGLAWFGFAWAVVRACVQSVTGDEAADYLFFAARRDPSSQWTASATNHLLNSALMRLSTSILGLSPLSVRLPTIIGAAIYIYVSYRVSKIISADWKVRIPILICLVYNPFIFDFFVAARGYGLANAFLLAAITLAAAGLPRTDDPREAILPAALSSVFLALSFSANFSFAFVDGTALLIIVVWATKKAAQADRKYPGIRWRTAAAGIVPGFVVMLFIPSWTLLHWVDIMIVAGGKTLRETLVSLMHASMYRLNPYLINPLLLPVFEKLRRLVLPVLGTFVFCQFGWILSERFIRPHERKFATQEVDDTCLSSLACLVGAIAVLTVVEHRVAYALFRLLIPAGRTAIFFIPLFVLLAGIAAGIPAGSRGARVCQIGLRSMLWVLSAYHLFSLRLTYFEEWEYQADINQAYAVVSCYNREHKIQRVGVSWYYDSGMNFYRLLSARETFGPFSSATAHRTDNDIYVLHGEFEKDFISSHGLHVVYRGASSMVVAVQPELADQPGGSCYVWPPL